jgi:transposase
MPPHTISRDLKAQIPALFFEQGFTVDQICAALGIGKSTVYKTLQYFHRYGTASNPHAHKSGHNRILSHTDIKFISTLVDQRHCIYLNEIRQALAEQRGCVVSIATLSRTLQRLDIRSKSVSIRPLEHNDLLRAAYMNRIADIVTNPDQFMFVDEAAHNRCTSGHRKGWAFVGKRCFRCFQRRFFVCGQRFSILPILTIDGIITHNIIPGSITADQFVQFLWELVIPLTNPYPGPRSVLILDNCRIHHSEQIRALVEDEALCKLVFLPPYSPDLNPIEQAFFSIKSHLRQHWDDFSLSIIDTAYHNINPDMAWGFIRSSGYIA